LGESEDEAHKFTLPKETYVRKMERWDEPYELCVPMFVESPLGASKEHGPVWILGQPFMREYVAMYDREQKRMGFAKNDPNKNCADV